MTGSATEKQECGETAQGKTNNHEGCRWERFEGDLREDRRKGNCDQNGNQQDNSRRVAPFSDKTKEDRVKGEPDKPQRTADTKCGALIDK
jgi:hypothetical protein